WRAADEAFAARRDAIVARHGEARASGTLPLEWAYVQLRLGRTGQAVDMLERIVAARSSRFGDDVMQTLEARGLHATALAAAGRRQEAAAEYAAVVPRIVELAHAERASTEAGLLRTTRLGWIFEGWIALLAELAARDERPAGLDPIDEAFRLSDVVRSSRVQ